MVILKNRKMGPGVMVVLRRGDYGIVATLLEGCELISETEYPSFQAARDKFSSALGWVEEG